ncbi:mitochondrial dynamin GTPase Msp1 [Friedmanniomyces endolithicus]|uniref:dynamin GTPase n=1 Tax=Friedmanniomyces endolithicus TaxID=329885 RepID=A0AAN6QSP0_9PEZI|nr:mitochondrial dynamin GTPase Msp1 [Friedmanniomyces endolithicus]
MISRLLSSRLASSAETPAAVLFRATPTSSTHHVARSPVSARAISQSVLNRTSSRPWPPRRTWPFGTNALHLLPSSSPTVRHASFARSIPKLALKLIRVPAMAGAGMLGLVAYIQYQASQGAAYAVDLFGRARDGVVGTAEGVMEVGGGVWGRLGRGWEKTKGEVEGIRVGMPAWMKEIYEKGAAKLEGGGGGGGGNGGPGDGKASSVGVAGAGVATVAAFGLDKEGEADDRSASEAARDDQMMLLTRKMIEIRSLLQTIGQSETLTLPSIVVVGSQSSGKSSVLEAIVGHEFLPKGSNMVTRRPIELTLVNTPKAQAEYGEFPALGLGKITDFSQIQKTLSDLNLAVPEKDCVSDDPIQLRIYSPNVPDLSLIDLPGYIQVEAFDQPTELKMKIQELCDKYIQPPNVILAISAADVDLANSTALRASRRVDPRGERTIGVVTKMDLVDPVRGAQILADRNYPLRLGYVGVVCKIPKDTKSLFSRGSANIMNQLTKNETAYFNAHPDTFGDVTTGTPNLRKKLMHVLEATMSASLATTSEAIQHELAEATYEFKVQYNERSLSAESYLAESLDAFKHSFKVADGSVQADPISSLPKADSENPLWHLKLDASTSTLTKLGIGRLATTITAQALQESVEGLLHTSTFASHPFAVQAITTASEGILRDLSFDTSDELEICVKPYKYRVEVDSGEWARGRANIGNVLGRELKDCETANKAVEEQLGGRRKAKDVLSFIDRVRSGELVIEGSDGVGGAGGFSAALLAKGREALFLRDRADILRLRLAAIKSRQCSNPANKYHCPEIFLDAVADKLTSTADLFLDAELLSKFYYQFPRVLERQFRSLDEGTVERFAREDPKIRRHLDVVRRKELLEHVLKEMEGLRVLEAREKRGISRGTQTSGESEGRKRKGWGIF